MKGHLVRRRQGRAVADAVVGPLLLGLTALHFFAYYPGQFRRAYRNDPAIHEPIRTCWTADGLVVDSERAKAEVPWRMFVNYRQNRHLFLVYRSPILFHIVPKRLLEAGDEERLRDIVRRKLGRAR